MGLLPRGSRPKPETEINQTAWNNHAVPYVTQLGAILTGQDKRENQDGEKRLLLLSTDLIIIHVSLIDILIVILLFFFFFSFVNPASFAYLPHFGLPQKKTESLNLKEIRVCMFGLHPDRQTPVQIKRASLNATIRRNYPVPTCAH